MASLIFVCLLFSLFSHLPKRRWYLFSTLFFRGFSFAGWCRSLWGKILIKTKPPWDPRKGHVELPCVEPAPQRDRPSWRTFELKRTFLFITASFPHNKGEVERLAPELKEHHTLHILLHCNPRTENYSSKKAFMAISREMPCNWLRNWPCIKQGMSFLGWFPP